MICSIEFCKENFFYLLVLASLSKQAERINNYRKILIINYITKKSVSFFQSGKVELKAYLFENDLFIRF